MKRVNNFVALQSLKDDYKNYVSTFQKYRKKKIEDWVQSRIETGTLLWQQPLVELNRRYKIGTPLSEFVTNGLLQPEIPSMFRTNLEDQDSETIAPYKHQSDSISAILGLAANIVVTTGTGSGKSFCFGIPIISECLRLKKEGVNGIKAVLVYPMNALINSQYEAFVRILRGSGLKISKYTRDTKTSPDEAREQLKNIFGREPFDSEIISREEIRDTPPDILMTNYVMLDILLTRHEDRALFPTSGQSPLTFIVLDEIHTYIGHRGADVACLMRRLKEHSKTSGKIRCIGTSATVESQSGQDSRTVVAKFASDLFGEQFNPDNVIVEYNLPMAPSGPVLSFTPRILVTQEMIQGFDGTIESVVPMAEALLGRKLHDDEDNEESLGMLFRNHPTILFLSERLMSKAMLLSELTEKYQENRRGGNDFAECQRELEAALLLGSVAINPQEGSPLIVPKIHTFFSQGSTLHSCLTKDGPHLNQTGDQVCSSCSNNGLKTKTYPLAFCRSCGQEFYGISILLDGTILPRAIDAVVEGTSVYITPIDEEIEELLIPDNWTDDDGKLIKKFNDDIPVRRKYCPRCNSISPECDHKEMLDIWMVPSPFQLCPSCGISYERKGREFGKLFEFSSVGRSTATDILSRSIMGVLPDDQRKLIVFTDNRQDTALQSAHMNDFYRRTTFRFSLYHALKNHIENEGKPMLISGAGKQIRTTMASLNLLPKFAFEKGEFFDDDQTQEEMLYEEFLEYLLVSELTFSPISNQLSLEEVGLLRVEYSGVEKLAAARDKWAEFDDLLNLDTDVFADYLSGILDIMRHRGAILHDISNNSTRRWEEWERRLRREVLFDLRMHNWEVVGFSDDLSKKRKQIHVGQRIKCIRAAAKGYLLRYWTEKALGITNSDRAKEIAIKAFDVLTETKYIQPLQLKGRPPIYQVNSTAIRIHLVNETDITRCTRCGKVFHWKKINHCTERTHPVLSDQDLSNHFFRALYTSSSDYPVHIEAREHSGQVSGEERQEFEEKFKDNDDPLNVLICTPTMELGIDIGDLSAIMMRNVPPDPSRYSQRAGRAGRKGQSSVVATFCGTGIGRGPHDQYFYRRPEKIVSGKIVPPRFLLDNKELIARHIRALVFQVLRIRLRTKFMDLLDLDNEDYPLFTEFKDELEQAITLNRDSILSSVMQAFESESIDFDWLTNEYAAGIVDNFMADLDEVIENWRLEYSRLIAEREEVHAQIGQKSTKQLTSQRSAIERKIERMRSGGGKYYVHSFLSDFAFLPSYGFPSVSTQLSLYDWQGEDSSSYELTRSKAIALREFAPHNSIYHRGQRYTVQYAFPATEEGKPLTEYCVVCQECEFVVLGSKASIEAACPECGEPFTSVPRICLDLPPMSARRSRSITCEEEERFRLGYDIESYYYPDEHLVRSAELLNDDFNVLLTYQHNGKIVTLNKGGLLRTGAGTITSTGFYYCNACKRWLRGRDSVVKHLKREGDDRCPKSANSDDIIQDTWLFIQGIHDVLTLTISKPEEISIEDELAFYTSLKEAILQGILIAFSLGDSEVDAYIATVPEGGAGRIVIFETDEGGVGVLRDVLMEPVFKNVIQKALNVIHILGSKPFLPADNACERACYDCLMRYSNQLDHPLLNRHLIVSALVSLIDSEYSEVASLDEGHLDSLMEKCDSNLEKETLKRITKEGIPLPSHAQYTIYDSDEPVTSADFFYEDKQLCVFVDGPPHEREDVSRKDKRIRRRLKGMKYRVLSLEGPSDVKKLKEYLGLT